MPSLERKLTNTSLANCRSTQMRLAFVISDVKLGTFSLITLRSQYFSFKEIEISDDSNYLHCDDCT